MPKRPRAGGVGNGNGAAPKSKGRSTGRGTPKSWVDAATVVAAVGKDEAPQHVPKPKSQPRRNMVPAAGPPVKKIIVKKVPIDFGEKEGTLKKAPRRNKGVVLNVS
jgi:hypothetical protein